jgi:hypothetical protein
MEDLVNNLLEFYRQSNSDIDKFELSVRRYLMSSDIFTGNSVQGGMYSPPAPPLDTDTVFQAFFDPDFLAELESLDPDSITDDDISELMTKYTKIP